VVFEVVKQFRTQRVGMVQTTVSWRRACARSRVTRANQLDDGWTAAVRPRPSRHRQAQYKFCYMALATQFGYQLNANKELVYTGAQ